MTILTARLGDPLTAAATLTLSYDDNLIILNDKELAFASGETETATTVTAINNGLANASARPATVTVTGHSGNISSVTPDSLELNIEPDDAAVITPRPTRPTIDEGEMRDVVFTVVPPLAQPATITATLLNEGQIALSGERLTVAAEQAQVTLNVTVTDDDVEETEDDYVIDLSVEGHATLAEDQITVTVPANDQRVADPRDIDVTTEGADGEDGVVAENSPAGATVGITVRADNAAAYTLSDSAEGRFAISSETGIVTVADGAKLNFEDAASHSITARAGNRFAETASITLTIEVINVDEITLRDREGENNTVAASAGAVVRGMTLEATHRDSVAIAKWELRQVVGLFEFTRELAGGSTQGLRIKADADSLSSRIGATTRLTVIARTEYDAATESFTIRFTGQAPVLVGELEDIDDADNEVAENSTAGVTVGITIQAENATTYTLTDSAGGRFAINPETGLCHCRRRQPAEL